MKYKKNILLDYMHTLFRSLNVTQGIWLIYLFNRGFSYFEIALFEGVFHITSLLFEIPTGVIADVLGRKTSRILGILSYFVYIAIILNSQSFGMIALGFVFCGFSYVFESGAAEAIVYDSLIEMNQEDKYMEVNGVKEAIFQISGFVALFVSGAIFDLNGAYNFYLTAFFFVIALIMIVSMREVPVERKEKKTVKEQLYNQFVVSSVTVMKNKRLFLLIIIGALMTAPITTIFFFLQNYFDFNGVPITVITMYIGLHAGASAIGGIFAYKLEKRYGETKILYVIPLLMAISFWLILIDKIILIPFILLGVWDSIFYVVLIDYINKMVSSEERATVLSFFGMSFSVVMIIVFTLIGYIINVVGFGVAFTVLAGIVTLFYLVLVIVVKGNHLIKEE